MQAVAKKEIYERVRKEIASVIDGEPYDIARYASTACLLSQNFEHFFWTGFYLVDPNRHEEMVVGPYQGTLGCLRIAFSRGVCGAAARDKKTIIVKNVHEFEGHIACDSQTNSEIVVPVLDTDGTLAGVLDIDSTALNSFDAIDAHYLELICAEILGHTL